MNKLVSVITPCFNAEDFILETILSVLNQTYKNFEYIIVDDGSIDNSVEIIKSIKDNRIKLIETAHTGMGSCAINIGISHANGEFIALIDADDQWVPEKLHKTMSYFEKYPDTDLVCSNKYKKEYCTNTRSYINTDLYNLNNQKDIIITFKDLFLYGNRIITSSVVAKKDCFNEAGVFPETPIFYSVYDYHMWLRVAMKYTIYYIGEPLGFYRIHKKGIGRNIVRSLNGLYNVLGEIVMDVPDQWRNEANRKVKQARNNLLIHCLKHLKIKQFFLFYWESLRNKSLL